MNRFSYAAGVAFSVMLWGSVSTAQELPREQKLKNLQIFPEGTTHDEIVGPMRGIAQALGVNCEYCHVTDRGDLDDKQPKRTARVMLRMTADLNAKLASELGKSPQDTTRIQCVTCHRGVLIPNQLNEIVMRTADEKGMPAAIDQYRALRKRYFGAQSYDFSENALLGVAQQLTAANAPDDALRWLQLNLEFNPNSASTHLAMAQVEMRKNNKDAAISAVQKALEIEPENAAAKRQLGTLMKP